MPARFVMQKILRALFTMLLVVSFVFVILRLAGDPALILLSPETPQASIDAYRRMVGLDRPIWQQYLIYLADVLRGQFGQSFLSGQDVVELVLERAPNTLRLTWLAFTLMLLIGIPAGITAALHRNSAIDRLVMTLAVSGYSMPNFFLGVLLIFLFTVNLRVLPATGADTAWHYVMPIFAIGTAGAGTIARFTRSAMLEVLRQPYIRAATAKGLPWYRVISRHALPNAAIPTVTVCGFILGYSIAGNIVIETVFAWPGVGRLLVTSVANRDLPVVQLIILLISVFMITANLTVDLLYGWLDPRIRTLRSGGAVAVGGEK